MTGVNRKTVGTLSVQADAPPIHPGWYHRYFLFSQRQGKSMLLENRLVTPAMRTIELNYHGRAVLQTHPIDPVFITVECQKAAITLHAQGFDRIQNLVRSQPGKGLLRRSSVHGTAGASQWTSRRWLPNRMRAERTGVSCRA